MKRDDASRRSARRAAARVQPYEHRLAPHERTPTGAGANPKRATHRPEDRPPLRVFTTTLWEYPSQHYTSTRGKAVGAPSARPDMQGDKAYAGATPSWVIWQLLTRYTRERERVLDPMCGSGTTLDVCADLDREGLGFDLSPHALAARPEIKHADARKLPLADASVDFAFLDPPYSTHIDYSDDPACIGKLDALADDHGRAYYDAMDRVIAECVRVLKPGRHLALYVSDSFRKARGEGNQGGRFAPIGFRLFELLSRRLEPIDIIAVVRHNQKLERGNWHKAAEEGNFFLRGFNYLFIMRKPAGKDSPR